MMLAAALLAAALGVCAQAGELVNGVGNGGAARYQKHLVELDGVVAGCAKMRNAAACDPTLVGADDEVDVRTGGALEQRRIRYDWLRALLARAGGKEATSQAPAVPGPAPVVKSRTLRIDELLRLARQRLAEDAEEAAAPPAGPGHASESVALKAIMARREFRGVGEETARERFMEWLDTALNEILARIVRLGEREPWIAILFRALFLGGVCLGLLWMLVRIERRARIRLIPDAPQVEGAPLPREWQLWLKDARAMAVADHWREAIHFLYWAAVARLESRYLWPVDRTRTPREVLLLIPDGDPRRLSLSALTRSFERTWYGGREAGPADYEKALVLAAALGVE